MKFKNVFVIVFCVVFIVMSILIIDLFFRVDIPDSNRVILELSQDTVASNDDIEKIIAIFKRDLAIIITFIVVQIIAIIGCVYSIIVNFLELINKNKIAKKLRTFNFKTK